MAYDLQLILNVDEPLPAARRIFSLTDRRAIDIPPLIAGETYSVSIYLVDRLGAYRAESGASGHSPRLILGLPDDPLVQVEPEDFAQIANGWSASLPLTSEELLEFIDGLITKPAEFEFNLTYPSGVIRSWFRGVAYVIPRLYEPGAPTPTPGVTYPTFAEMLRGTVRNLPAVTRLTGGGATALDGVATVSGGAAAGDKVLVYLPGTKDLLLYEGVAAAPPAESAWAIIADDQPAAFYWRLIAHLGRDGKPVVYNNDQGAYHKLVITGAAGLEQLGVAAAFSIPLV